MIIISGSCLTGGLFLWQAHKTGYSMLEKESEAKATTVAGLSEALVQHLMLVGKKERVSDVLRTAKTFPQVKEALVLNTDGSVALSADSSAAGDTRTFDLTKFTGNRRADRHLYRYVKENGQSYEYVLDPIDRLPECAGCHDSGEPLLGYMLVKVSTNDLQEIALSHRLANIGMTVASFGGLAVITFFALSLFVVRPIRKMRLHIRTVNSQVLHIEPGEQPTFSVLPEPRGKDEVSDLARAFNDLIKRLNEANSSLFTLHHAQLEHADRIATVGEMAASVAHEIRNPIAGVLNALQIFETGLPLTAEQKDIMHEMMSQLDRVNDTVNDLLRYARPTAPVFEEVSLHDMIRKIESLLTVQSFGNPIEWRLALCRHDIILDADRKLLQQLLWNIIVNAMQAMSDGGTLTIITRYDDGMCDMIIADTGPGIPEANLERIYKPFFTTRHKGTGLGLAISRKIVEQHQGTMIITNGEPVGAKVLIRLPARAVGT